MTSMNSPFYYSICIFLIASLILSVIYAENIKQNNKKHILAAMYVFLAAIVYMSVILINSILHFQ